jgi:hypothetical protein
MATRWLMALLTRAPLIAHAGGATRCLTREDPALQRWVTECSDQVLSELFEVVEEGGTPSGRI